MEGLPRYIKDNTPIPITVRFSETAKLDSAATGRSPSDHWTIGGATLTTAFTDGSAIAYTGTLTPSSGSLSINIGAGTIYDDDTDNDENQNFSVTVQRDPTTGVPTVIGGQFLGSANTHGFHGPGDKITVALDFSEPVLVTGTPRLKIDVAGTELFAELDRTLNLLANRIAFSLETPDNVEDTVGVNVVAASLELNGGTITDQAKNAATLSVPGVPDLGKPQSQGGHPGAPYADPQHHLPRARYQHPSQRLQEKRTHRNNAGLQRERVRDGGSHH